MNKYNKIINANNFFYLVVLILLLYNINMFVITFDAAMNFQVSKSISISGDYATYYNVYELFDHNIQTGAPVIVPTAILNSLFGVSSVNMQVVTTLYLFLLIIIIKNYISGYTNNIISIIGALMILLIPTSNANAWMGLGELAMGFWMFSFFILFLKGREKDENRYYFLSGICFAFGYLTKTVFLICLPAIFLIFLYDTLILKEYKIKVYLIILIGILIPILMFEIYKLLSLGFISYIEWWTIELEHIIGQMGLSDRHYTALDSVNKFVKARLHIDKYSELFNISVHEIFIYYLTPGLYFSWQKIRAKKVDINNVLLYVVSLTYFIWWCFLIPTSKTWSRRVLLGHILIILLMIIIIGKVTIQLWNFLKSKKHENQVIEFFIIFSLCFLVYYSTFKCLENSKLIYTEIEQQYSLKKSTIEMAEEIKKLPEDAVLYGISWWQNPVFSVLTDRMFYDLSLSDKIAEKSYFIEDHFMSTGEKNGVKNRVESQYVCELITSKGTNKMYKLTDNFNEEVRKQGNYIEIKFADKYVSSYNVYLDFGNGFNENDKQNAYVKGGKDYALFKIADSNLKDIRFDFSTLPNKIEIKNITIAINGVENIYNPEAILKRIYNINDISKYSINGKDNFEIEISGSDPHFKLKNIIN